jgi:serine-type D-Ala-D-Ala carboxypeptidase/endopeptidase (penicillin-binding protein 4)
VSRDVRTSRAAALVAAVVLTAGAGVGYVVVRHRSDAPPRTVAASSAASPPSTASAASTASPGVPSSQSSTPPLLVGLSTSAPQPTPAGLRAALAPAVRAVAGGAHLVGEVVDAASGAALWVRGASEPEPPASTAKLLTAAAALTTLGPDHRLTTTTRRVGRTLYLVGGGDPTMVLNASSASGLYPRPASYSQLARRTAARLGAIKTVRLRVDASAWDGPALARGWKPSYVTEGDVAPPTALELDEGRIDPDDEFSPRSEDPAAQAGEAFAELLEDDGVHVVGSVSAAHTPARALAVASVESAPVAALVQRMLTLSDDDLAEALGRAVAVESGRPPTFAGAAAAVTAAVAALGVDVDGVSLQDASGLSHRDRVPPRTFGDVLALAASVAGSQLRPIVVGLPVAGLTGTLAFRYLQPPASTAAGCCVPRPAR